MLKKIFEFFKKPKKAPKPSEKETAEERKTEPLSETPRSTKVRPSYDQKTKPQIDPRIKLAFNYFKAFPVGNLDKSKTVAEHVRELQESAEKEYRRIRDETGIAPDAMAAAKAVNVDGRRVVLNVEFLFDNSYGTEAPAVLSEDSKKRLPVFEDLLTCFLN